MRNYEEDENLGILPKYKGKIPYTTSSLDLLTICFTRKRATRVKKKFISFIPPSHGSNKQLLFFFFSTYHDNEWIENLPDDKRFTNVFSLYASGTHLLQIDPSKSK